MTTNLIETWRNIIQGKQKSWVLFRNGTCVILMKPELDLAAQAKNILKEWGPVYPGTSSADFSVIKLENNPGWVVTCHHPDILNYVFLQEEEPTDLLIGMLGRSFRDQDAQEQEVIHIEDKR